MMVSCFQASQFQADVLGVVAAKVLVQNGPNNPE